MVPSASPVTAASCVVVMGWPIRSRISALVDELRLHLAPVLLGAGRRLFENLGDQAIELERTRIVESPYATHLDFSVRR